MRAGTESKHDRVMPDPMAISKTLSIRECGYDEYWLLERRRWPQRQHFAVLVAENITRRFFNVIQLFSLSIPIIAIQANIIEADARRMLHFAKILDAYEEPEDEATA